MGKKPGTRQVTRCRKLLDPAPKLLSAGFDFNWISISCRKTFKSPFVPFTVALRLSSRKIQFNRHVMLWADKHWNWIWMWYSACLHNSPTQKSSRTRKMKNVQGQTFAYLYWIIYSKLYGLWGSSVKFTWGEKKVFALARRPFPSVVL